MAWTTEKVQTALNLASDGFTCAEIGERIGMSRNAVIGKFHRIGAKVGFVWRAKAVAGSKPPHQRKPRRQKLTRIILADIKLPEPIPSDAPPSLDLSLFDLNQATCRWPYGDGPFFFCGHACKPSDSYCSYHMNLAYPI